ncbi:hypothetical protein [Brenneria tiliae]|uniref:Uncharacterized protein n=1 Tax=Brenneria tiliae TaxID=2914984 RepID=A0ABT0N0F6_9GAMM|nr:hypothetical protein [Brenneria tiliae]MCL2895337.1 hypothetical protein [Brenneria tiliae]
MCTKQNFSIHEQYTRTQIQKEVGGELQTYLPQRKGIILAGCFNKELNPDCPHEVQAGKGVRVTEKAKLLISQPDTVFPVFVKDRRNNRKYKFVGHFRCISGSNDPEIIKAAEQRSGRTGKLSYVLSLESVVLPD